MNNLDIHPRIIAAVNREKLNDFGLILSLSAPDIERITQLSLSDVTKLQKAVAEAVCKKISYSALDIYLKECPTELVGQYLSTGCPIIDKFLRGGVICPGITEIVGESTSGKTQFCMQLSITVQLSKALGGLEAGAVYVCTEDVFPNKRLVQMVQLLKQRVSNDAVREHNFTDNIYIEHVADMDDLSICIKRKVPFLLSQRRVKLVIIDSVAGLFRYEFDASETVKRAKSMSLFAACLHKLSNKYTTAIVCVNQVSDAFNKDEFMLSARRIIPALGIAWSNLLTCRLVFQRTNNCMKIQQKSDSVKETIISNVRSIEVVFAPHLSNSVCCCLLDNEGFKGLL